MKAWRRIHRPASRCSSRHLFDRWSEVAQLLRAAKHIALILDFDGTIVPIQRRPEMVRLGPSPRRLIGRLAKHSRLTVCIVSGRSLADLRGRAGVPGVRYVGLHGWEWSRKKSVPPGDKNLDRVKLLLKNRLGSLVGIRLEDKGISFAVHYRGATQSAARRADVLLRKTLKPFEPHLHVMNGKKVWEVLPPGVQGKGRAVRLLLANLPSGTLPIYIGDDTTDESAFAELGGGITVRVGGHRRSKARFTLRNPGEVLGFLETLEAETK
ncbi:MAG: trehalose-phosphatase [Acidobacteria bacterium]|nr:trehalose-phosphatase [Acidobacteriota bacterium]